MRTIGEIDGEAKARRFSDFLFVQGVPNEIEPAGSGSWEIWIRSDDDIPKASRWLTEFRANPDAAQFGVATRAAEIRAENEKDLKEFRSRVKGRDNVFRRFVVFGVGPLTAVLICTCILIALWTRTDNGEALRKVPFLFFSEYYASPDMSDRILASPEVRSGQIWRIITPMLLHFGIFHILFNMLWLRDLGGMIETVEGTGKLLGLILVSAAFSNWAQYVVSGNPNFGGMSGVVYALLGYVWMKGKYHPGSGLYLHKETVTMMLIWLVIGFIPNLLPINMANWAHLGGLAVGVAWGYFATRTV